MATRISYSSRHEEQLALNLQLLKFPQFVREYPFHKTRKWRLDFFFPDYKVGIEVQGGIHTGGHHVTGTGYEKDCDKLNEAQIAGIIMLYVTPKMIKTGEAVVYIERALWGRGWQERKEPVSLPAKRPRKNVQRGLFGG